MKVFNSIKEYVDKEQSTLDTGALKIGVVLFLASDSWHPGHDYVMQECRQKCDYFIVIRNDLAPVRHYFDASQPYMRLPGEMLDDLVIISKLESLPSPPDVLILFKDLKEILVDKDIENTINKIMTPDYMSRYYEDIPPMFISWVNAMVFEMEYMKLIGFVYHMTMRANKSVDYPINYFLKKYREDNGQEFLTIDALTDADGAEYGASKPLIPEVEYKLLLSAFLQGTITDAYVKSVNPTLTLDSISTLDSKITGVDTAKICKILTPTGYFTLGEVSKGI